VPIQIRIGRRVFAPSWVMTGLTVVLSVAFIGLGRWQWERGNHRQAEWDKFERGAERVMPLRTLSLGEMPRFQRISLIGRFDAAHQFLLDNRTYNGRAGYEVLTPLERPDGRVAIVDRGWVPFSGLRDRLPGVAIQSHDYLTLTGRVADLPSAGLASGKAPPASEAPWPKVTSYPSLGELSTALGHPLEPRIVLLDKSQPDGYVRDWHPPGIEPTRHWSYAVQWWSFAVVLVALWGGLNLRKIRDAA
jgi:cytochrome oxidase assembly protein ShyY1